MGVIPFPWRVWFYVDARNANVVRVWLNEIGASASDREGLQTLIEMAKAGGAEIARWLYR